MFSCASNLVLVDVEQQVRLLALEGRLDESGEQRVRIVGARAQLGVRLGAHVVRVHFARQLDEFDEVSVGARAREHQAGVGETVLIVSGSSARMATGMKDCPVDAVIVGIVDEVSMAG